MDVGRHPKIRLLAYSEVESAEGELGNFRIRVRKKARYVDENKCTGCGSCAEKCPTVVSDAYNVGLAKRKAIYKYFAQGIPSVYAIDAAHCRNFETGKKCGLCSRICQAGAIDYQQEDRIVELDVGAIILATGYELFDARKVPEYGYGRLPNVVTSLEFERFLSASGPTGGHVYKPSDLAVSEVLAALEKQMRTSSREIERFEKTFEMSSERFIEKFNSGELTGGHYDEWARQYRSFLPLKEKFKQTKERAESLKTAHRLAFIQCVGSRDSRFNRHCSAFCCMHSIKEAVIAREHDPESEVHIFGMDIRAVGKNFEEYRNRAEGEAGIKFIRSRVAEVTENGNHNPVIWYEDTKARQVRSMEVDLAILAVACEPGPSARRLSELLGVPLNEFGFYATVTVPPLDTLRPGVFACGCAHGPMDIPESVAQASSAAARAARALIGARSG
jgi:heterodisulfide reductase subunit A-like polyferredoxin